MWTEREDGRDGREDRKKGGGVGRGVGRSERGIMGWGWGGVENGVFEGINVLDADQPASVIFFHRQTFH